MSVDRTTSFYGHAIPPDCSIDATTGRYIDTPVGISVDRTIYSSTDIDELLALCCLSLLRLAS